METKEYTTSEICKIVKDTLAKRWDKKDVSVTKGRGTASGWVDARLEIDRPSDCHCKPTYYCDRCKENIRSASQEARKRVYETMKKEGATFFTYCSDDGFNTDRDCFLLHVNIKKNHA